MVSLAESRYPECLNYWPITAKSYWFIDKLKLSCSWQKAKCLYDMEFFENYLDMGWHNCLRQSNMKWCQEFQFPTLKKNLENLCFKKNYSVWIYQWAVSVYCGIKNYIRLWTYTSITVLTMPACLVFLVRFEWIHIEQVFIQIVTRNIFVMTKFWWSERKCWTKTWFL